MTFSFCDIPSFCTLDAIINRYFQIINIDGLGDVMVRHHRRDAARQIGDRDADHRGDHLVGLEALSLLDCLHPHVEPDVMRLHRIVGGAVRLLGELMPLGDEVLVRRRIDRLKVVPRRQVADQRLGVEASELFFADRERHDRDIGRLDPLVAELLIKRHVGVAVDRRHHGGLLAAGAERFDLRHFGLPVREPNGV